MSTAAKAAAAKKKAAGAAKIKSAVEKVIHGPIMATNIPAGMASAGPPLGTMLGQASFFSVSKFLVFIVHTLFIKFCLLFCCI